MSEQWNAHLGIIGLCPPPWDESDMNKWPTEGYDGHLHGAHWDFCRPHANGETGHTRDEWDALAVEMIGRWAAWRDHLRQLPNDLFLPPTAPQPEQ